MKKRGSAIIIAMLLISTIGVIAFGIARLVFIENRTVALYENGAVAYYAAESGLEESFLRYRYNQNVEVPFKDWKLGDNKVYRTVFNNYDLKDNASLGVETGAAYSGVNPNNDISSTRQTYDLRVGYIGSKGGPYYGIPGQTKFELANFLSSISGYNSADLSGENGAVFIPRNDSIKIDLSGYNFTTNNLNLYAKFYGNDKNIEKHKCKALIEIKFTVTYDSGKTGEYKDLIKLDSSGRGSNKSCDDPDLLNSKGINSFRTIGGTGDLLSGSGYIYYLVPNLQDTVTRSQGIMPSVSDKVILSIHPLYYDVAIGLVNDNCKLGICGDGKKRDVVSGPFTEVKSVGYFGGVAKTLTANIDRQSGSLYDLFDYVIFTEGGEN